MTRPLEDITVSPPVLDVRDSSEEQSEQTRCTLVDMRKSVKLTKLEEMSVEAVGSESV